MSLITLLVVLVLVGVGLYLIENYVPMSAPIKVIIRVVVILVVVLFIWQAFIGDVSVPRLK